MAALTMEERLWRHDVGDEIRLREQAGSGRVRGGRAGSGEVQGRGGRGAGQRRAVRRAQRGEVDDLSLLQDDVGPAAAAAELDGRGGGAAVQEAGRLLLGSPNVLGFLSAGPLLLQLHGRLHGIAAHALPEAFHGNDGIQRGLGSCCKRSLLILSSCSHWIHTVQSKPH